MSLAMAKIDILALTKGEVRNLAGHDRGLKARHHFHLDDLDVDDDVVDVVFPHDFRAVSPSFFQGMFANSVHKFGDVLKFFDHYRFDAPVHIRAQLIEYAEQVANR